MLIKESILIEDESISNKESDTLDKYYIIAKDNNENDTRYNIAFTINLIAINNTYNENNIKEVLEDIVDNGLNVSSQDAISDVRCSVRFLKTNSLLLALSDVDSEAVSGVGKGSALSITWWSLR